MYVLPPTNTISAFEAAEIYTSLVSGITSSTTAGLAVTTAREGGAVTTAAACEA